MTDRAASPTRWRATELIRSAVGKPAADRRGAIGPRLLSRVSYGGSFTEVCLIRGQRDMRFSDEVEAFESDADRHRNNGNKSCFRQDLLLWRGGYGIGLPVDP